MAVSGQFAVAVVSLPDEPALVSAARLSVALRTPLRKAERDATYEQLEYISDLAGVCGVDVPDDIIEREVASAWIGYLRAIRAIQSLEQLRPAPGNLVGLVRHPNELFIVSSISSTGRVNFRISGWHFPHRLHVKVKANDMSKESRSVRKSAANSLENRRPLSSSVSDARLAHLKGFLVSERAASDEAVTAFEERLIEASDERPLQDLISRYPALLRPIAAATTAMWVIPQVRLGSTYVADFMVGHHDSTGVHWIYVELESPTAAPILKVGTKGSSCGRDWIKSGNGATGWREYSDGAEFPCGWRRGPYEHIRQVTGPRACWSRIPATT